MVRLGLRVLLWTAASFVVGLLWAAAASAHTGHTYTDCPAAPDPYTGDDDAAAQINGLRADLAAQCNAIGSRLRVLHEEANEAQLSGDQDIRIVAVNVPTAPFSPRTADEVPVADVAARSLLDMEGEATLSQKVRLSRSDRDRLDLAGFGVWAIVGLLLCLLFANRWHSAWRFLR